MSDVDLTTCTLLELVDELRSRADLMFIVIRPLAQHPKFQWMRSYKGDPIRILGQIEVAKNDLLNPNDDDNYKDYI